MKSEKIEEYIRWVICQLVCNDKVDHRGYSKLGEKSRLSNYITNLRNVDEAINKVVQEMFLDDEINKLFDELKKSDDEDEKYDLKCELFSSIILFIGLYEIFNLHGSEYDKFLQKFNVLVFN